MTEAENLQRALQAQGALEVMDAKFRALENTYTADMRKAATPDEAWQAVLRHRALIDVVKALKSDTDTAKFDRVGKE